MKKLLLVILALIPILLFSYTIEETLLQIESLKKELAHNEHIVEEKISNLKKSNPLFADQDSFESSAEYAERLKKGQPIIDRIRKQYLDDPLTKLSILRNRMFETEYVEVTLGKYNPDTQIYPMKIQHLYWQKEIYDIELKINRTKAKTLYQNWNKVKKIGIRTIDIGDKIGLAKIRLFEPISSLDITHEFQPYASFSSPNDIIEVCISPDGNYLGLISYSSSLKYFKDIEIIDLKNQNKRIQFDTGYSQLDHIKFSTDSKFVLGFTEDYNRNINITNCINVITKKEVNNFHNINSVVMHKDGSYICTYIKKNYSTPDKKYEVKLENRIAKLYRKFPQIENEAIVNTAISRPPSLTASVEFSEPSNNQYLDALEKGDILITVTNNGEGSGKGLTIKFDPEIIDGMNYNNSYIEEIPSGKSITVKIPIEAYIDVTEGDHLLRVNFDEINGFPPAPVEIGFSTKSYLKPEMFIVDVGIEDNNQNGMIESGETTKLTVRIGNKGKGVASGAYAKFYSEDNVFITDSFPKVVSLDDLEYNQHIDVPLEFFVNDKAKDEIPLYVDLTEATGISGVDHLRIPILKSERTREIKRTIVAGIDKKYGDLDFENDLSVDVEQNISKARKSNKNALAIIFGIENYRNVSNVNFAYRDATIMKEYFSKTIGIPEDQIYFRANDDVTLGEFRKIFSKNGWLDKRVIKNETDVYFYYAGHGAPAIKEEKAFLIPFDGDPNYPVMTKS